MLSIDDASNRERAAVAAFARLPARLRKGIRDETARMVVPAMRAAATAKAPTPLARAVASTARYSAFRGVPGVAFGGTRAVTRDGTPGRVLARGTEYGSTGTRWWTYQGRRGSATFQVRRRTSAQFRPDRGPAGAYVYPAAEQVADDVLDLWVRLVEDATVAALDGRG